jgi:hypothetical protein
MREKKHFTSNETSYESLSGSLHSTNTFKKNILFNGYCRLYLRLPVALLYIVFHCLSLHVSAYMAIFRCRIYIYIYNGYCRLCLRLTAALLYVGFSLSFTTCFGLHGHLQVRRIYIYIYIYIQWALQVMSPSACSFIVRCFPLSFTICFGLHGHLHVCRNLHIFKDSASLLFWFAASFYVAKQNP